MVIVISTLSTRPQFSIHTKRHLDEAVFLLALGGAGSFHQLVISSNR